MKTSNYIIIAFLSFFIGGIFIYFLTSSQHFKDYKKINGFSEIDQTDIKLDDFSVIVAEPKSKIFISKTQLPHLTVTYPKLDSCSFTSFEVRNDTLFLNTDSLKAKHTLNVYCPALKSVIAKNKSTVRIHQYPFDTLQIESSSSKIFLDNVKTETKDALLIINVGNNSKMQVNDLNLCNINLQLSHSELNIQNSEIKTLSGNIMNESKLYSFKYIGKINLEVDSSSVFNLSKQIQIKGSIGANGQIKAEVN